MSWFRLYLMAEGETEFKFAKDTLAPHLVNFEVDLLPRMILTNRKLGTRGGALEFQRVKRDITHLMKEDSGRDARFTTMFDFYALPAEYPGWDQARQQTQAVARVAQLEKALYDDFGDRRFIPFLQLHEFEALLYCDLNQLQSRIEDSGEALAGLCADVSGLNPEEINDGEQTAPSKRLIRFLPRYEKLKVRVGAPAAGAIGLNDLRQRCPHFGQWLSRLENLE
jgi:hypothetical protein